MTAVLEWLALAEYELLLFACVFFLVGAVDELVVDVVWLWMRLMGRIRTERRTRSELEGRGLAGPAALLIPTWHEEKVIGQTIAHALRAWPQHDLRIYAGCYPNDPETISAVSAAALGDSRVRLVIGTGPGPTTKADCLNMLYCALERDEARCSRDFRFVVLHDAEDMVDPAALAVIDQALGHADFVQLPVLPEPQRKSRWIGSHYCEEFAEAHGKAMVVRAALATSVPAAGVGCAFARRILREISQADPAGLPFSTDSLTEDYELGLRVRAAGGRSRFCRVRGDDGRLVATRAFFPNDFASCVRQKSRWVHGIAFQGWERLGWGGGGSESWMRLRDRRGPLNALVLACGYLLLALLACGSAVSFLAPVPIIPVEPFLMALLAANLASFALRAGLRFAFTAREYGIVEGARAILRIPITNFIAICAGWRALTAYLQTLHGTPPRWEKTEHFLHPAAQSAMR